MTHERSERDRLRDTAITSLTRRGFDASLADIAADAGATEDDLLHHFASRAGLRAACDGEVLDRISAFSESSIESGGLVERLAMEAQGENVGYILRCLREGGEIGRSLLEHLIEDALTSSEEGVARGLIKPSRDARARARYLTTQRLGGILLDLMLIEDEVDLSDGPELIRRLTELDSLPALEVFAEGLFTSDFLLQQYLRMRAGEDLETDATSGSETDTAEGRPVAS